MVEWCRIMCWCLLSFTLFIWHHMFDALPQSVGLGLGRRCCRFPYVWSLNSGSLQRPPVVCQKGIHGKGLWLMLFSLDIPGVGIKGREMSEAGCHERYSKDIRIAEPSYLLSASTLSGEQRSWFLDVSSLLATSVYVALFLFWRKTWKKLFQMKTVKEMTMIEMRTQTTTLKMVKILTTDVALIIQDCIEKAALSGAWTSRISLPTVTCTCLQDLLLHTWRLFVPRPSQVFHMQHSRSFAQNSTAPKSDPYMFVPFWREILQETPLISQIWWPHEWFSPWTNPGFTNPKVHRCPIPSNSSVIKPGLMENPHLVRWFSQYNFHLQGRSPSWPPFFPMVFLWLSHEKLPLIEDYPKLLHIFQWFSH